MTKPEGRSALAIVQDLLAANPEGLRGVMQEMLEAEMIDAIGRLLYSAG